MCPRSSKNSTNRRRISAAGRDVIRGSCGRSGTTSGAMVPNGRPPPALDQRVRDAASDAAPLATGASPVGDASSVVGPRSRPAGRRRASPDRSRPSGRDARDSIDEPATTAPTRAPIVRPRRNVAVTWSSAERRGRGISGTSWSSSSRRHRSQAPLGRAEDRDDADERDPDPRRRWIAAIRRKSPIDQIVNPSRSPSVSPAHAPRMAATTSEREASAADCRGWRRTARRSRSRPGRRARCLGPGSRGGRERPARDRCGRRRAPRRRRRARPPGRARPPRRARRW